MSPDVPATWPAFSTNERRVLGVLVEKQKTTDTYPLTVNSIVTGANQKSNRDPLLNLPDYAVEETLDDLKKKGLVMQVVSGRVDKWRHLLYETWKVTSVELAILAELLLRGPQPRVVNVDPVNHLVVIVTRRGLRMVGKRLRICPFKNNDR